MGEIISESGGGIIQEQRAASPGIGTYEVRDAKDYFAGLPELAIAPDMLTLAAQILESKVAEFDPKAFRDRGPYPNPPPLPAWRRHRSEGAAARARDR